MIVGSSPHSFDSSTSNKRSLEKPLNSVGQRQVPFSLFRGVHEILARRRMPFLGDCLLYTTCERPQMSSYDGQKLAWFGGRESEERSATGNVKPRKPQGVFVNMATFFFGRQGFIAPV